MPLNSLRLIWKIVVIVMGSAKFVERPIDAGGDVCTTIANAFFAGNVEAGMKSWGPEQWKR